MSINHLAYRIAKSYGIAALGEALGMNTNTFKNKVNPNIDTHHVYAHELDLIAAVADTDEIARYFADQRGLMCIKKPDFDGFSDEAILELFLDLQAKQGMWANEIRKAIENGDINWNEYRSINKHYKELTIAIAEVMSRLQSFMVVTEQRRVARTKKCEEIR